MKTLRRLLLLNMCLAVCVGSFISSAEDSSPPANEVLKVGSVMKLNQAVSILPQSGRVYFQDGSIVKENEVDQYRPSCNLHSYKIDDNKQEVVPDSFEITHVKNYSELVQASYPVLASQDISQLNIAAFGTSPIAENFVILLDVKSAKNSHIKQMQCLVWRKPNSNKYLTMADMRQALGDVISFGP